MNRDVKKFQLIGWFALFGLCAMSLSGCAIFQNSSPQVSAQRQSLEQILVANHRSDEAKARDLYRHPIQTLMFFGVQPDHSVIEIWPGGGWYTQVLAPYLKDQGQYIGAGFGVSLERTPPWRQQIQQTFNETFLGQPDVYGNIIITELDYPERLNISPSGNVDRILTFRNVHNWIRGDYAEQMFDLFYNQLKPGGILGVVQHRADTGASLADMKRTGYVPEEYVISLAQASGFQLVGRSEINANVLDNRDHPEGVWSLPPTFRGCKKMPEQSPERAQCFQYYRDIGESDRMTLRFIKPE